MEFIHVRARVHRSGNEDSPTAGERRCFGVWTRGARKKPERRANRATVDSRVALADRSLPAPPAASAPPLPDSGGDLWWLSDSRERRPSAPCARPGYQESAWLAPAGCRRRTRL